MLIDTMMELPKRMLWCKITSRMVIVWQIGFYLM